MIRLLPILKEVADEKNLSPEDKDKLEQARELLAPLENLEEGALDENKITDIAKKLKNLGLSAALLATLAATPNLSAAQQKAIDAAKPTTTQTVAKQGTAVDGIYGQYTSQFRFPRATEIDLMTNTKTDLGLEGHNALKQVKGFGIDKMKMWNKLTDFAETHTINGKKIAGNPELDKDPDLGMQVIDAFNNSPEGKGSWIKDTNDIKQVQTAMKAIRTATIESWKKGVINNIVMSGTRMDRNKPEDVKRVESNFMFWAKDK